MCINDSEKNDTKTNVITGAFSLTFSVFIIKILGLLYKIPLSLILGDKGMGYFNSAYTAYTFFYIVCSAGVPKSVMMIISEEEAIGKRGRNVYKVAIILFGIIGAISCLIFVLLSPFISKAVGSSKAIYSMLSIAPSILFISISGVIRGLLNARMRLIEIATSQVIEGVGKLVFGLVFAIIAYRQKMELYYVSAFTIFGITLGSLVSLIYLFVCAKNKKTNEKIEQNSITNFKSTSKRILSISIPITISACVMSISNIIDLALIMRNLEAIGYSEEQASAIYGNYTTLAVPMLNLAIALISPICISFMPTLTKARVLSNNELFKEVEKSAMETVSLISAPITVGLIFYSKEVLTLIYRNSDIEMGSMLLIILSPSIIFASILSVVNSILESSGFVKAPMVSMLFGGFAKLIVSYFLIKNPLIGISGAPIGTVVSYSVALIVSLVIYEKRLGGFPKTLSLCVKPYLIALITVSVSMFLYNIGLHFINPKISFIIIIVFTSILYLSASLLTGILSKKKVEKMAKYTNFAT